MSNADHDRDGSRVEQLIGTALRDQPWQRAPRALQQRVLERIEQRTQRAWWQQSYAAWPALARAVLLIVCSALAGVSINATLWMTNAATSLRPGYSLLVSTTGTLLDVQASLVSSIPSLWIYGALGAIALTCAGAFGIGTLAWRTLYVTR